MTRVAFVSVMGGLPWGASELLWAAAADRALTAGHDVVISVYEWTVGHERLRSLESAGATVIARPRLPQHARSWQRLARCVSSGLGLVASEPLAAVHAMRPDVICLSQGNTYEALEIPGLCEELGRRDTPYVVICNSNNPQFILRGVQRERAECFLRGAATLAFVSESNRCLAERQLAGSLRNAVVVQNPVNLRSVGALPWPDASTLRMASVGRLDVPYKGQDVLLEVLAAPAWRERAWECRLYGDGPDQAYLEQLARYHGLEGRVRFMGHVPDVAAVWEVCHLLVVPSRVEGGPLALIEAMVCGRPAVVTDVGATLDWIREGESGFVADAATVRSLGAALERAWECRDQWADMGERAYRTVAARRDTDAGRTFLDIVLRAAAGRRASRGRTVACSGPT